MPTFRSSLVPQPTVRPVSAPVSATPAPLAQTSGEALTLDALMARQKAAAQQQATNMESPVSNIPQGLGQLAWTFVNGLKERRAEKELAQGHADVANAFKQVDWSTGQLPDDAMATLMQRDPDLGIEMYKTAMALKATQAKTDQWTLIPTPEGENGQWYKNQNGETKKVGGGSDSTVKDASTLRQDVISDPAYKNLAQSAPIWSSMADAYTRDTPQADLNMVIALAKLFDPTSVVRTQEGEQVVQTGGLPSQIFSQWKFLTGEPGARLMPDVRKGMMDEAWSRVKGYQDAYSQLGKQYTENATRNKINPLDVVPAFDVKPWVPPETQPDPNNPNPDTPPAVPPTNPETGKPYIALPNGKSPTMKAGGTGELDFGDMTAAEIDQWLDLNSGTTTPPAGG